MAKKIKERGNAFFRLLDRYAGIPLVAALGSLRRKTKEDPKHFKNIVFIKMGAIGDSILTLPFIKKLNQAYGDVKITVICGKNNQAVYQNSFNENRIDQIICVDFIRLIRDWAYTAQKMKQIRAANYSYCIDFDSWYRISALISFIVKADYKIGFKKKSQFKHHVFDQTVTHQNNCHEFENYQNLARPIMGDVEQFPDYPTTAEDAVFFNDFMADEQRSNYIVVHPWASGYKNKRKQLDQNSLVYIGNTLAGKGIEIIITGSKADREKSESLVALIEGAVSIAGKTSLNETAIFLKNARCVITMNTGILHLAAAMSSKIVSVNGPTDIHRWGPLAEEVINIKSTLFCSPCLDLGFEYKCRQHGVPAGHCMNKIDLDEVVAAALRLL